MKDERQKDSPLFLRRMIFRNRLLFVVRENPRSFVFVFISTAALLYYLLISNSIFSSQRTSPKTQDLTQKHRIIETDTRLLYNRVPKCGSSTLVNLLQKLAVRNGFVHHSSPLLDEWHIFRDEDQKNFTQDFLQQPASFSYDRHLFFIDFTRFNAHSPIYINLIRDPTERFISEFYFRRRDQAENVKKGEKKWLEEDLDMCVEKGKDYDCRLIDGTFRKNMIAFFCGNHIECSKHNDRTALDLAKRNVANFYEVVGILEDLELTIKVLEKKIPQYFAGAWELYQSSPDHVINKGKNKASRVSDRTKQLIRNNLTSEYEFYDFVRGRLLEQNNIP